MRNDSKRSGTTPTLAFTVRRPSFLFQIVIDFVGAALPCQEHYLRPCCASMTIWKENSSTEEDASGDATRPSAILPQPHVENGNFAIRKRLLHPRVNDLSHPAYAPAQSAAAVSSALVAAMMS